MTTSQATGHSGEFVSAIGGTAPPWSVPRICSTNPGLDTARDAVRFCIESRWKQAKVTLISPRDFDTRRQAQRTVRTARPPGGRPNGPFSHDHPSGPCPVNAARLSPKPPRDDARAAILGWVALVAFGLIPHGLIIWT